MQNMKEKKMQNILINAKYERISYKIGLKR